MRISRSFIASMGTAVFALCLALTSACTLSAASLTDSAGRAVTVPDTIGKAAAAGPPAATDLYIVAPDKMAGWVKELRPEDLPFVTSSAQTLPVHGRITGKNLAQSQQAVAALKPDLIVDIGDVTPGYAALADQVQQELKVPYMLIDGTLAKTPDTLKLLGTLLGAPARSESLAKSAAAMLADAASWKAAHPEMASRKIYWARGPEGLETFTAGSINVEFIEAAGAQGYPAQGGKPGSAKLSIDQIVSWNPDIILVEDPAALAKIRGNPAWANIAAVKAGKVFLNPSSPFGWVDGPPAANRLLGIKWVQSLLEGKSANDPGFFETAHAFYSEFYAHELTQDEFQKLVAQP